MQLLTASMLMLLIVLLLVVLLVLTLSLLHRDGPATDYQPVLLRSKRPCCHHL